MNIDYDIHGGYFNRLLVVWGLFMFVGVRCDGIVEATDWIFNTIGMVVMAPFAAIHPRPTAALAAFMAVHVPESVGVGVSSS